MSRIVASCPHFFVADIAASCPHFFVADIAAAVDHYQQVLGFNRPRIWGEPPAFAMPARDDFIVMLNQVDDAPVEPNGNRDCWDAYFWCTGVAELFAEFESNGAHIVHGLEDREHYGMREFAIKDLDGYMLAFAEDLEKL